MAEKRTIFTSRGLLPEALDVAEGFNVVMPDGLDLCWNHAEMVAGIGNAEGLVGWGHDTLDADLLDAAPNLKIVAHMGVGYDMLDVPLLKSRGLMVTHTPDVLTETTSDMALALLMAVARRLVEGDDLVRNGQWTTHDPYYLMSTDPRGKQLGVIGFGRIGQGLARKAKALGMTIAYADQVEAPAEVAEALGATRMELDDLLRTSRFISLHVPLRPDTKHLISARELSLMPEGSFVINTSRGPVLDTAALVDALDSGRLAGAGLDVFETEPGTYPELHRFPNVVMTPHAASCSRETRAAMARLCLENVVAVLTGNPPLTPIPECR